MYFTCDCLQLRIWLSIHVKMLVLQVADLPVQLKGSVLMSLLWLSSTAFCMDQHTVLWGTHCCFEQLRDAGIQHTKNWENINFSVFFNQSVFFVSSLHFELPCNLNIEHSHLSWCHT